MVNPPVLPPLERQIARAAARARTLERLGQPAYRTAAATGAMGGASVALGGIVTRLLPSLTPQPPVSLQGALTGVALLALLGALLACGGAAVLRGMRRAWVALRYRDRAV
jgi:hypothetical protein